MDDSNLNQAKKVRIQGVSDITQYTITMITRQKNNSIRMHGPRSVPVGPSPSLGTGWGTF